MSAIIRSHKPLYGNWCSMIEVIPVLIVIINQLQSVSRAMAKGLCVRWGEVPDDFPEPALLYLVVMVKVFGFLLVHGVWCCFYCQICVCLLIAVGFKR